MKWPLLAFPNLSECKRNICRIKMCIFFHCAFTSKWCLQSTLKTGYKSGRINNYSYLKLITTANILLYTLYIVTSLRISCHIIITVTLWHDIVFLIVPALQMRKEQHRRNKQVVQGHTANEGQRGAQNQQSGPGPVPLTIVRTASEQRWRRGNKCSDFLRSHLGQWFYLLYLPKVLPL